MGVMVATDRTPSRQSPSSSPSKLEISISREKSGNCFPPLWHIQFASSSSSFFHPFHFGGNERRKKTSGEYLVSGMGLPQLSRIFNALLTFSRRIPLLLPLLSLRRRILAEKELRPLFRNSLLLKLFQQLSRLFSPRYSLTFVVLVVCGGWERIGVIADCKNIIV